MLLALMVHKEEHQGPTLQFSLDALSDTEGIVQG